MLKRFLSQSLTAAEGTKVVTNVYNSGSMSVEMAVRVGVRWGVPLFDTTMQIIYSCDELEGRLKKKAPLLLNPIRTAKTV